MAFGGRFSSLGKRGWPAPSGLPIAIDFGVGSLKVLQLTGASRPALVAAACLDTPDELIPSHPDRLAFQCERLPKLIKSGGFKGRRAVCAVPAALSFCKHMQVSRSEGVAVPDLIKPAVAAQLNRDPGSLVFRHAEVPDAAGSKQEVICMAASRGLVEKLMDAIREAKLEPVGMQTEYIATVNAFAYLEQANEALTTLNLDIGVGGTKATITHGHQLVFAKAIDLGGFSLDRCLAEQLDCTLDEARRARLAITSFAPSADQDAEDQGMALLAAAMRKEGAQAPAAGTRAATAGAATAQPNLCEQLEILTDEVSMCLRYHDGLFPARKIDRLVFAGGEARHTALCRHVARALGVSAHLADPLAKVTRNGTEPTTGVDIDQPQPGWAVAMGLSVSPTDL